MQVKQLDNAVPSSACPISPPAVTCSAVTFMNVSSYGLNSVSSSAIPASDGLDMGAGSSASTGRDSADDSTTSASDGVAMLSSPTSVMAAFFIISLK